MTHRVMPLLGPVVRDPAPPFGLAWKTRFPFADQPVDRKTTLSADHLRCASKPGIRSGRCSIRSIAMSVGRSARRGDAEGHGHHRANQALLNRACN